MPKDNSGNALSRILIIRFSAIGDVLLTTPLIRCLQKQFPEAKIDFVVKEKYASLINVNPHIRQVWTFSPEDGFFEIIRLCRQIRNVKYDGIIDLQVNVRSLLLRVFSRAKKNVRYKTWRGKRFFWVHFHWNLYPTEMAVPLRFLDGVSSWGVEDDGFGLELHVDSKAKSAVKSHLEKRRASPKDGMVVLAPGASKMTKRWPSESFAILGKRLQRMNYQIVLVGGDQDRQICEDLVNGMEYPPENFSGRLSLQKTAALIAESNLLISNDTGVMHMGAALKKPVVAIFGPTTRHLGFMPFRTRSIVVEKSLACRPCSYHGTDACPKGHFRCMKDIQVEEVLEAAKNLLDEK